jgi:hypothetical protein
LTDVVDRGAAELLGQRRAEEAELAHLVHDLAVEVLVAIGLKHPRQQLLLAVVVGRIADEPLLLAQLVGE